MDTMVIMPILWNSEVAPEKKNHSYQESTLRGIREFKTGNVEDVGNAIQKYTKPMVMGSFVN
jgi:hypothetical protein